MDEEFYPGPHEHNAIEFFIEGMSTVMVEYYRHYLYVGRRTYEALVNVFGPVVEAAKEVSESLQDLGEKLEILQRKDQDQPAHITIRRNHGPYAGSGYDRRGRKRY